MWNNALCREAAVTFNFFFIRVLSELISRATNGKLTSFKLTQQPAVRLLGRLSEIFCKTKIRYHPKITICPQKFEVGHSSDYFRVHFCMSPNGPLSLRSAGATLASRILNTCAGSEVRLQTPTEGTISLAPCMNPSPVCYITCAPDMWNSCQHFQYHINISNAVQRQLASWKSGERFQNQMREPQLWLPRRAHITELIELKICRINSVGVTVKRMKFHIGTTSGVIWMIGGVK